MESPLLSDKLLGFLLVAAIRLSKGIIEVLRDVLRMVAHKVAEMRSVDRWGTRPTRQRQAELEETLHEWEAEGDHGDRRGPFDGTLLNGAEVFWLAVQAALDDISEAEAEQFLRNSSTPGPIDAFSLSRLHLEGANLEEAHLDQAYLLGAYLNGAYLAGAYLNRANLKGAHLQGAVLVGAHLQGVVLVGAYLEDSNLQWAWTRPHDR